MICCLSSTALKIKIRKITKFKAGEAAVVAVYVKEVKVKKLLRQFFTTEILLKIKSMLKVSSATIIQESMHMENVFTDCQSDQVFEDSHQPTNPSNITRKEFDKSQFIHKNTNPSSAPDTLLSMHTLLDVDCIFWISVA